MKTIISNDRLTAAISSAYRGTDACHCQTVGKLSENELRWLLFFAGIGGPDMLPKNEDEDFSFDYDAPYKYRLFTEINFYQLRHAGAYSLRDLTKWNYNALLRLPGYGPVSANKVEKTMARVGLLLADGDPALIEQVRQERDEEQKNRPGDRPPPADISDPEATRQATADGLFKLVQSAHRDGMALISHATAILSNKKRAGKIKAYISRENTAFSREVSRICGPFFQLEAAESARKKVTKKPTDRAAPVQRDNLRLVAVGAQ